MPAPVRQKATSGGNRPSPVTPMSERQQMALLMQMTSQANEPGSSSPSSSRHRDRNERGETALHLAAIKGDVEQVSKLLTRIDPNVVDFAGWTPLHEACNHGWYDVAYKLVQAGANVNAQGLDNDTPLHDAAINGHLRLVKMLVENGADIETKNLKGKAPLDVAASPTVVNLMLNPNYLTTEQAASRPQAQRSRDDKKFPEPKTKLAEEAMDTLKPPAPPSSEDIYDFKAVKDSDASSSDKVESQEGEGENAPMASTDDSAKRPFADVAVENPADDNDEETKRKRPKTTPQKSVQKGAKQAAATTVKCVVSCASPKSATSDAEVDDGKSDLKVPPLKIVIPQGSSEQETGSTRNGKSSSQRSHQALPYVVASGDVEGGAGGNGSPSDTTVKNEEKKDGASGSDDQAPIAVEADATTGATTTPSATPAAASTVELHPRKRKMKQSKEPPASGPSEPETPNVPEVHPYEQPITNGYQLYLNIRKQIEKRRKALFPVQPKPPQGFGDYLLNTCTYVLAGKAPTVPNIAYPPTLPPTMTDLFTSQEKDRYRLRMQHVIEKEKMVLSVEQEILRVHGRAARALANHSLPFSACTILRDEEVYNLITPEQEEKDRNARSRYNGRLFLSWLQDLDDKWEKIKERMILRHHNEAESLHAVQKMDWEWKLKELNLCDRKTRPTIDETHVPMVDVSDELNLLIIESGP